MERDKKNPQTSSERRIERMSEYINRRDYKIKLDVLGYPSHFQLTDISYKCDVCGATPAHEYREDEFLCLKCRRK
jgi:hypothetical protein